MLTPFPEANFIDGDDEVDEDDENYSSNRDNDDTDNESHGAETPLTPFSPARRMSKDFQSTCSTGISSPIPQERTTIRLQLHRLR